MDYQELITSYNNKGLDVTNLKENLKIAKPLKGRLKYRAIDIISQRSALLNDINNLLITLEKGERVEDFNKYTDDLLNEYFMTLVKTVEMLEAWKFMRLIPTEFTEEKFEKLNYKEKFKLVMFLNREYLKFLEYQNIADIRDCLKNAESLDDDTIRKLEFLGTMFNNLKNKEVKIEFFCFDKDFLMTLYWSRKFKNLKFDDFIKNKKRSVKNEYKKLSKFFTNEDFIDISKNLEVTSKVLKTSVYNIIEAYSEMSESESEVYYIEEEFEQIKQLLKKYKKMQLIKKEYDKKQAEKKKLEKEKKEKELQEKKQREQEEAERLKKEQEEKEQLREIIDPKKLQKTPKARKNKKTEKLDFEEDLTIVPKEQVNPLIFTWFEREDKTITRRIGSKVLTRFFEKIKEIESSTGARVALYMVTNAGKEVTLKRLEDLKKKAFKAGIPNLVEGALGAYGSFRADKNGKITDIAEMTVNDKEKIIKLLQKTKGEVLTQELIDQETELFIRYQMTDKKDKNINKKYLNLLISNLLKDEEIRMQPLKFLVFMEGKKEGIDVLFEEQLKAISQLSNYYKEKYLITNSKTMNIRIDNIEDFIEE